MIISCNQLPLLKDCLNITYSVGFHGNYVLDVTAQRGDSAPKQHAHVIKFSPEE